MASVADYNLVRRAVILHQQWHLGHVGTGKEMLSFFWMICRHLQYVHLKVLRALNVAFEHQLISSAKPLHKGQGIGLCLIYSAQSGADWLFISLMQR